MSVSCCVIILNLAGREVGAFHAEANDETGISANAGKTALDSAAASAYSAGAALRHDELMLLINDG